MDLVWINLVEVEDSRGEILCTLGAGKPGESNACKPARQTREDLRRSSLYTLGVMTRDTGPVSQQVRILSRGWAFLQLEDVGKTGSTSWSDSVQFPGHV